MSLPRNLFRTALSILLCSPATTSVISAAAQASAHPYLTTGDGKQLLERQAELKWHKGSAGDATASTITVDDSKTYQRIDGFGHTLTGGSAQLLMGMSAAARHALLREIFGSGPNDTHVSYLRVTIAASDMNDHVYTYDDMPDGQTDPSMSHFSLAEDERSVIPVLREIVAISPQLRILASPWTPPVWMKSNGRVKGGSLRPEYADAYASYFVHYLQGMQAHGIRIDALTVQNEPENANNTPSLLMTAEEEADFIGRHLGPALRQAGLKTKIVAFDHNCDNPGYPETVLRDKEAAQYVDGSGFHLYRGEMQALSTVHDAFPRKNVYFTEQMVVPGRNDPFPIAGSVARLIIAAPRNWSRNVLLWNLAADSQNGPHTSDGGCPMCAGALTLEGDQAKRLVAYYAIAQVSKFVPPGSVRIDSGESKVDRPGNAGEQVDLLPHVAFLTPAKQHALLVANPSVNLQHFAVHSHSESTQMSLPAGAVVTLVW